VLTLNDELPPGTRWASVKEAADAEGVVETTIIRWAKHGWIEAYRSASGHGRWHILVGRMGFTVDKAANDDTETPPGRQPPSQAA